MRDVGCAVIDQELQRVVFGNCLDVTESPPHSFDEHFTYWLVRQSFTLSRPPSLDLTITAVFSKGGRDGLARVAHDLQTI